MLAFDIKRTERRHELNRTLDRLAKACTEKFADATSFNEEFAKQREKMRSSRLEGTGGGAADCKATMLGYLKHLQVAEFRYRGTSLRDGQLKFEWRDSFNPDELVAIPDWRYERVGVLFNAAASLAYMATHEDRGTPDGVKNACNYFQQAAGTIDAMKGEIKAAAWQQLTPDLTSDMLDMLHALMLAQAQKCFYEKAARDGIKEKLLTMLAAEAAALYRDASLSSALSRVRVEFAAIVRANAHLFDALQNMHAAAGHLEALEYGKQVARLSHAAEVSAKGVRACSDGGVGGEVLAVFQNAHVKCVDLAQKAKKDNDLIYTEKVPVIQTLPPLDRKLMVKPLELPELGETPEMPKPLEAPPPTAAPVVVGASNIPAGPSHTVELKLYKPHPTTKLGLTLTSQGTEAPAVTAVTQDGVGQALVKLGDVILSVNGTAGAGHEATTTLLRHAVGEVAILVQRKGEKPPTPAPSAPVAPASPSQPPMPPPPAAGAADPPPPSFESVTQLESEALTQLKDMGFGEAQASAALKQANQDMAKAVELLAEGKVP